MATGAKKGYGSIVEYGDGLSPQGWTRLAEVLSIGPVSQIRGKLTVTNLDSPNESEEYIPSMKAGSDITISVNETWVASQLTLKALALAGATVNFRIRYTQYTPNRSRTFAVAMTGVTNPPITPGDVVTLDYLGTITGDIT